ncbi:MAG: ECF transporter S component [Candidatus Lokiarchaeota archaeon]|nr:ECF transporter S component [Candidatus Lokiarchaeota archaeon]
MTRRSQDELVDEGITVPEGYMDTREYIKKNTILGLLTVRDLLYASVLGIMGGFISSLVPFSLIIKAIYPFWGGSQLMSGHHMIWMSIAYGTTKKKSSLLITALLKGVIEFLLGDRLGAFIILMNIFEGLSLMVGFIIIEQLGEYKTNFGWSIAGGIGNVTQAPIFWWIAGRFGILHWSLAAIAFTFAFLSGCFITGFLGRQITISIKRSMGEIP